MKKHETLFRWIKSRSGLTFGGFFTLLLGLLFYLLFRKASTPLHEIGSVLYLGSNHLPAMAQNSAPSFIFALSIILIEAGLLGVQNKRHIFLLSVKWCLITIIFECLPLIPNLQRYSTFDIADLAMTFLGCLSGYFMVVLYYHHYSLMPWRGPHHIIKHPILLLAIFCELATSKGSTDYMKMRELRQKKLPIGDTPAVIKTLNDMESCREVPS